MPAYIWLDASEHSAGYGKRSTSLVDANTQAKRALRRTSARVQSALACFYHAPNKRRETANQQDGPCRQRRIRNQYSHQPGDDDDGHDGKRKRPVVHEQPGQLTQHIGRCGHDKASVFGRRASATAAQLTARNIAANPTIAKSAPGQGTPRPSPVQKTPNADSMTPTANLSAFSGIRAKGRRTMRPTAATARHAKTAPALAGMSIPRPPPSAITMNTTSSPSRSIALRVAMAASQSSRSSLRRACSRNSAVSVANAIASLWS